MGLSGMCRTAAVLLFGFLSLAGLSGAGALRTGLPTSNPKVLSMGVGIHAPFPVRTLQDQDTRALGHVGGGGLSTIMRRYANCLETPLFIAGEARDGRTLSLYIVSDDTSGPGRRLVTVINGEPVYVPVPGDGSPRPIMPKVQSITFQYKKILTPAQPYEMTSGWYTRGQTIVRINNFKDHRDGTVDIPIPVASNAMFEQPSSLYIKTDRCVIHVPIRIVPKSIVSRWFPPTIVTQCALPTYGPVTFGKQSDMSIDTRVEKTQSSARRHEGHAPNQLFQNCGPYGALHEGGNRDGVGRGSGTDNYLFWGGQDTNPTVDILGDCNVTKSLTVQPNDTAAIGATAPRNKLSEFASRSVIHLLVNWQFSGVHEYCAYVILIRGRHPVEWPSEWRTRFSQNNFGLRSSMEHKDGQSTLFWLERDGSNSGRTTRRSKSYTY